MFLRFRVQLLRLFQILEQFIGIILVLVLTIITIIIKIIKGKRVPLLFRQETSSYTPRISDGFVRSLSADVIKSD